MVITTQRLTLPVAGWPRHHPAPSSPHSDRYLSPSMLLLLALLRSASGQIITESLASSFPTVIVYVVDTVRCRNAVTFMSNMLYACSILYKLKLPLVLAFNKTDAQDCSFAMEWMSDLDAFTEGNRPQRARRTLDLRTACYLPVTDICPPHCCTQPSNPRRATWAPSPNQWP